MRDVFVLQACAFTEAKLKMSDVTCALTLCSVLHKCYADFAPSLLEHWQKVLLSKKDDKVSYGVSTKALQCGHGYVVVRVQVQLRMYGAR